MKTIQDILDHYRVTSFKALASGLLAIRKRGYWLFFKMNDATQMYELVGSQLKLH